MKFGSSDKSTLKTLKLSRTFCVQLENCFLRVRLNKRLVNEYSDDIIHETFCALLYRVDCIARSVRRFMRDKSCTKTNRKITITNCTTRDGATVTQTVIIKFEDLNKKKKKIKVTFKNKKATVLCVCVQYILRYTAKTFADVVAVHFVLEKMRNKYLFCLAGSVRK